MGNGGSVPATGEKGDFVMGIGTGDRAGVAVA